jgi:hypothetical protein
MTPRAFVQQGSCEQAKGLVHASFSLISLACFTYNAVAWLYRHETHLAANVMLYGTVAGLEARKAHNHFTS